MRRKREHEAEAVLAEAGKAGAEGSFGKEYLTNPAKRGAIALFQACDGMSERRACRVIDADSKSKRYHSTRDDDAPPRENLRELANQTLAVPLSPFETLLRRDELMINRNKLKGSTR